MLKGQKQTASPLIFGGISKMRHLPIVCLLFVSSVLWKQHQPPATADLPAKRQATTVPDNDKDDQPGLPQSASKIAPDATVITIQGLCAPRSSSTGENPQPKCQTRISRTQFEKLTDAVLSNKQASRQRQFATAYSNLLAMAQSAEILGLEKSPRVQQRIAFARLQILSQEMVRQIDEESAKIPKKQIADYYRDHSADFETATLERIFIPNRKREVSPADKDFPGAPARAHQSDAEINRLAENLRARAVAGENFLALQKEAYAAAGMTDVPPNSSLGQARPNTIPPGHASVFDLKPGEVSKVISDPTGHYIYKLDSKQPESLEETNDEIQMILKKERRDKALQGIQQPITTQLDPAYFGSDSLNSD
jgi:hypothetical protein